MRTPRRSRRVTAAPSGSPDAHMCPVQGAQVIRAWEPGHQSAEVGSPKIQGVARVRTMPSEQEEYVRDSSLWQRAHMIVCSETAIGRMQAARSCHTPRRLCRRHRHTGSSNRKARSTLQSRWASVLTHTWMQMSPNATVPGYRRFRRPRSPAARNETGHLPFANRAGCKRPRRRAAPSTIWTRMGRANRQGRLDGANLWRDDELQPVRLHAYMETRNFFLKRALSCDGFQSHYSICATSCRRRSPVQYDARLDDASFLGTARAR